MKRTRKSPVAKESICNQMSLHDFEALKFASWSLSAIPESYPHARRLCQIFDNIHSRIRAYNP